MKLLFCLIDMNLGGTEKSFLNLIATLPTDYEIDLILLQKEGELLHELPQKVHVIEDLSSIDIYKYTQASPLQLIKYYAKNRKMIKAAKGLWSYARYKFTGNGEYIFKIFDSEIPVGKKTYDIAIAYAGPHNFISYFVGKKVKAVKKINWIHFDVSEIVFDLKTSSNLYAYFDEIKVVSKIAQQNFIKLLPAFRSKTTVFSNILNVKDIKQLSTEKEGGFKDNFNGVRILTVGRLTTQKGHDFALPAIRKLVENGYNLRYYILGSGVQEKDLKKQVRDLNLDDFTIFLGSKKNPYPFMLQTDIYLQPSRHEGEGITVLEAKVFHKPIVVTNYTVAYDTIQDGITGLIVEMNSNAIFEGLRELIDNKSLQRKFKENLMREQQQIKNSILPF